MARLCERPGCNEPASVAYGFDAERHLVVIDGVAEGFVEQVRSGVLCRRHADALSAPRGWWIDDRRESRPSLFHPDTGKVDGRQPPAQRTVTTRKSRRPTAPLQPSIAERSLFDIDINDAIDEALEFASASGGVAVVHAELPPADEATAVVRDPDETKAIEWTPVFDQSDDLDGLLNARSPLLSRAFGKEKRTLQRRR